MRIGFFLVIVSLLLLGTFALSGSAHMGPISAHFDGYRFHNLQPIQRSFDDYLDWMLRREAGSWEAVTDAPIGSPPAERIDGVDLRVTHVNHSTVLLQTQGMNILTDPIWSERASPFGFIGPKRYHPPGIRFEDLPPIDLVLISHSHYDHMDLPTLRRLSDRDQPLILVGLGNAATLEGAGIENVEELDWWQTKALGDQMNVTGVPVQHWSSRSLVDRNRTLWLGYVVEAPGGPVYFAGDTGLGPHFAMTRERFGAMRLALLPIGAFRPRWFMKPVHISPDEAVEAHQILQAKTSLAVHHSTFRLGEDGQHEAPRKLRAAIRKAGLSEDDFWIAEFGFGRWAPPLSVPAEDLPVQTAAR